MKPVTVTIPVQTTTESNAKGHWRPKAERAKKQRWLARTLVGPLAYRLRAGLRARTLAGVVVTFTRLAPRELDDDNLASAMKHVRDGVADALEIDDRDPRVRWVCAQVPAGTVKEYGVRIVLQTSAKELAK
ncbi:MAG TPA: hypothetical protein VF765_31190 [Polyangiaceae bacterium]